MDWLSRTFTKFSDILECVKAKEYNLVSKHLDEFSKRFTKVSNHVFLISFLCEKLTFPEFRRGMLKKRMEYSYVHMNY